MSSAHEDTRLVAALRAGLVGLATRAHRNPLPTLLLVALLTAGAALQARTLRIDPDIANLLPQGVQSVAALEEVERRFGGGGFVSVVASGLAPEDLRKFADEIAPVLAALPSVRYVDHRRTNSWFRDRALYYLDLEDLEVIQERVEARANYERRKANPLLVALEDEGPPALDFADIEARYEARASKRSLRRIDAGEDYYLDAEARRIALLVKPDNIANDLSAAARVVQEIEGALEAFDKSAFEGVEIALTGRYKKHLDQQAAIKADLGTTTGLALLLMLLYLAVHFRRLAAVGLIASPLLLSMVWTFGLAAVRFESLSILTGFAGAILLGLGVDHGIHLLGRYQADKRRLGDGAAAIEQTFSTTGRGVLLAACTTLVAFLGLSFTEVRAFREFGQMTAWGTAFVVLAYAAVLPALLGLFDKLRWKASAHGASPLVTGYAKAVPKWSPSLFWLVTVIGLFLAFSARHAAFDYDFDALSGTNLPSYRLDKVVNEMLGRSQSPLVILLDEEAHEAPTVAALRARSETLGETSGVDFVASIADLVPPDQEAKQEILQDLRTTMEGFDPDALPEADRKRYRRMFELTAPEAFAFDDLPIEIRRQFSVDGSRPAGGVVLVFSRIRLSDGERVRALAKEIRGVELPGGITANAAGSAMVLADILSLVFDAAPRILAVTMVMVFFTLWLLLGRLSAALLCFLPAPLTVFATLGLAQAIGLKVNYINMVVVPVLFGITVDAGVHLIIQGAEHTEHIVDALTEVGRGVLGATLTTAFGFGTLTLAHHPGLNSLGQLALLGLAAGTVMSLVWLPGLLGLRHVRIARISAVGHWESFTGRLATDLGTVYGAGYSPKAPGTFGAWAGLPIGYLFSLLPLWPRLGAVTLLILVSFPIATRYMKGRMSAEDPQEIVYDELIGVLMPLAIVPWSFGWATAAFVAFRFFDISKPGPVGWVDKKMKSPAGVMLDDVVAGALAMAVLLVVRLYVFDLPLS